MKLQCIVLTKNCNDHCIWYPLAVIYFISVHGGWTSWGGWEGCSSPCGPGVAKRHRICSNPTPSLYGRFCQGDAVDFDLCIGHDCGNITTTAGKHFVLHLGKYSYQNISFSNLPDHIA